MIDGGGGAGGYYACTSFKVFQTEYTITVGSGGAGAGLTGTTAANAQIFVNTAGYIVNVTVNSGGSYANTPVATANQGNAAFTITMGGRANRVQQETLVAMGSMYGDSGGNPYP